VANDQGSGLTTAISVAFLYRFDGFRLPFVLLDSNRSKPELTNGDGLAGHDGSRGSPDGEILRAVLVYMFLIVGLRLAGNGTGSVESL